MPTDPALEPAQSLPVHAAGSFVAVDGANLGDPLGHADELIPGDVYMLAARAERRRMAVTLDGDGHHLTIASGGDAGRLGAALHFDCCATLMSADGATVDALILVEIATDGVSVEEVWLFPLAPLMPRVGYALVALDRDGARARFAETACVSFTRGTQITLSSGRQVPIEALSVGDSVLTRDHGPERIRWIGQQTVRALGAFAPIRIAAGTLNNENDLIVSPNHRLFVYQRRDTIRAGRAEVLVKAKYLLNGATVTRTDGGFVDYFQLLFDSHEIIYAEGIAAESLMVDTRTRPVLPPDLQDRLRKSDPAALSRRDLGYEVREGLLDGDRAVELLRQATAC
ncbi:Hint domain-containing protein [Tranquillimonas rosea]|uniref:Hint domain-containing protein n=1 Tax=Tranquillimonas rosea TaxID=641238 RepID=A0A1H9Q1A8_9RHOB|nr:Hint domain-containing protein [Tranquillimonas rosea]SER54220.1 Hint domain-containing protein [Tranquillimonas rosea]